MRDPLGLRSAWFQPKARRVIVTSLCLFWAVFEFANLSPIFGVLFGGLGLYSGWVFFIDWKDPEEGE